MLIDVLLVVGDDGLGDGLTDGVDLGGVTTTGDADTDVNTGELVNADDQEGLVDLSKFMSEKKLPILNPLPCLLTISFSCEIISIDTQQNFAGGCECAYLEAEDLGLDQGEGLAVNLDEALALL